jgi:glucose/arabinose dehydrogenase
LALIRGWSRCSKFRRRRSPEATAVFLAAVTPFAAGLANPRRLLVLPNGDVVVAEQSAGYLTLLRDDGGGRAIWINRHVED